MKKSNLIIVDQHGEYHFVNVKNIKFIMEKKELKDPVIIEAEFVRESSKSGCFDCEGNLEWFPKSQYNYDAEKNELEIPRWLAREKFPNENF